MMETKRRVNWKATLAVGVIACGGWVPSRSRSMNYVKIRPLELQLVDAGYAIFDEGPGCSAEGQPFCIERNSRRHILVDKAVYFKRSQQGEPPVTNFQPGSRQFRHERDDDMAKPVPRLHVEEQA